MGARQSNLFSRPSKATAVSLSLSGGRELIKNFHLLPVKLQKKVARQAVTKIARLMVKKVKGTMGREEKITGSPKTFETGLLRKSIGFRVWVPKTSQWSVGATIGPRTGFGTMVVRNKQGKKKALTKGGIAKVVAGGGSFRRAEFSDPARYGHLVEGGSTRRERGTVEGRPFMEHAYLRSRRSMMGALRAHMIRGLEQEARKLSPAKYPPVNRWGFW